TIFALASLILTIIGICLVLLGAIKYPEYAIGFSLTGTGFIAIGWAFNALKGRV
ncbi:MAG: CAL67264 family membrane protein, partial [Flavobacteriaceae bacterium]|nr:CAL67264 family membrane protein [Flavobacteriaceae bacterium]